MTTPPPVRGDVILLPDASVHVVTWTEGSVDLDTHREHVHPPGPWPPHTQTGLVAQEYSTVIELEIRSQYLKEAEKESHYMAEEARLMAAKNTREVDVALARLGLDSSRRYRDLYEACLRKSSPNFEEDKARIKAALVSKQ